MSRFINSINAMKSDVSGICRVKNVRGVVTGLPMHALRVRESARYLLARLLWRLGTGPATLAICHARPVVAGAGWTSESPDSGAFQAGRLRRPSRPRFATGLGRF